jgi:hypothetical protein
VVLAQTGVGQAAQTANASVAPGSPTSDQLPIYEVDPTWPPRLPNDWIWGDIRGLFVDDDDHLWVLHMPSSLTRQEIGAAMDPPIADCCFPAPPVLELDPEGKSSEPGVARPMATHGSIRSTGSISTTTVSSGWARATGST